MITRAVVLVAVLVAGGAAARAQDRARADKERSRALYDQGSRAYKAGDYPKAVERFLAAYDLSHMPAILFNVAQAYRLQGACDKALEYYRRSLAEEPDAANRAEVEERIDEMQRCTDQEARERTDAQDQSDQSDESHDDTGAGAGAEPPLAAPDSGSTPPPPAGLTARAPERPPSRRSILPLVTAGIGAAVAVTGGIIYFQARAKFDQVESTCPCEPGSFSGWETATDVSYVLMGAGAVTAGAGLIWWWRQSHRAPKRIGLLPTARGVIWAGSF